VVYEKATGRLPKKKDNAMKKARIQINMSMQAAAFKTTLNLKLVVLFDKKNKAHQ